MTRSPIARVSRVPPFLQLFSCFLRHRFYRSSAVNDLSLEVISRFHVQRFKDNSHLLIPVYRFTPMKITRLIEANAIIHGGVNEPLIASKIDQSKIDHGRLIDAELKYIFSFVSLFLSFLRPPQSRKRQKSHKESSSFLPCSGIGLLFFSLATLALAPVRALHRNAVSVCLPWGMIEALSRHNVTSTRTSHRENPG